MRRSIVTASFLLLLAVSGLSWTLPAQAQEAHPVTGTVQEADSGEPLPGANVYVAGTQRGTSTTPSGRYVLRLPPGTYELVASFTGYEADTLSVSVEPDTENRYDFTLRPTTVQGEEVVVYAGGTEGRVQSLARTREERRRGLQNYRVRVHKLGLVYEENRPESGASSLDSSRAVAFSERVLEQTFVAPDRFAEQYVAKRASDNFFAGFEVFSTGGPLDLNENEVELNILSEVVSVVGPISERAPEFYELDRTAAGPEWPNGTTKITVEPTSQRRPLFRGEVFIDREADAVIGMDLELNEAGDVFTGIYSFSDFKYQQEYKQVDDFWLPSRTVVEARVGLIGVGDDFLYRERWNYEDYQLNESGIRVDSIPLSGTIAGRAGTRQDSSFWSETGQRYLDDQTRQELRQAQSYEEDRFLVNFLATAFQTFHNIPRFLQNSYFTNVSDFYRFNRVEGHFVGAGLRTPATNQNFAYKAAFGYATEANDLRYDFEARQFIPGTSLAVEGSVFRRLAMQFADYPYDVGPLNVDRFRQTLQAGFSATDSRNYFEREGFSVGLRWRFDTNTFFRAGYLEEDQTFLPVVAPFSFFESFNVEDERVDPNRASQVGNTPDGTGEAFTEGRFAGAEFQFHHDTRQYKQVGIFRSYRVRNFGWYSDQLVRWGAGSDENFNYVSYRSAIGARIPLFSSHYLLPDLYVGGSDRPLPAQMQFGSNGFYVEDYLRRRPFETLGFNEGIGNRITALRLDYDLGSGFIRLFPVRFIRQSGIQVRLWGAAGVRHDRADLGPVTPFTDGAEEHAEVGIGVRRIFGVFSFDVGVRVEGDAGQSVGVRVIL